MEGGSVQISANVDNRVVGLQFDNRQFEKNVGTSIESLDKLKKSLDLEDSASSFSAVEKAASKMSFDGLVSGVETIKSKFSAFEVVAITALQNITNSVINSGKQWAKSLSIDQITSGFTKYEEKTASVQTIMAATGKDIDEVNQYLDKLMWFTDETSYNFADMTSNIGKFTSAGVELDVATDAMMGIANWAALSGQNAQAASRAMYNLSQAIGTGSVKLIDWKSIWHDNGGRDAFISALQNIYSIMSGIADIAGKAFEKVFPALEGLDLAEKTKQFDAWLDSIREAMGFEKKLQKESSSETSKPNLSETERRYLEDLQKAAFDQMAHATPKNGKKTWMQELAQSGIKRDGAAMENWTEADKKLWNDYWDAVEKLQTPRKKITLKSISESIADKEAETKTSESVNRLTRIFNGAAAAVDILKNALISLKNGFVGVVKAMRPIGDVFMNIFADIGDWFVKIDEDLKKNDYLNKAIDNIMPYIEKVMQFIANTIAAVWVGLKSFGVYLKGLIDVMNSSTFVQAIKKGIGDGLTYLANLFNSFFGGQESGSKEVAQKAENTFGGFKAIFDWLDKTFAGIKFDWNGAGNIISNIGDIVGQIFGLVGKFLGFKEGTSFLNVLGSLFKKLMIADVVKNIVLMINNLKNLSSIPKDLFGGITDFLKNAKDSLKEGIFAIGKKDTIGTTLLKIAGSIAIMVAALALIAGMDSKSVVRASWVLIGVGAGLLAMTVIMKEISSSIKPKEVGSVNTIMKLLIAAAASMLIFAASIAILGNMKSDNMIQGLFGVGAMLVIIAGFSYYVSKIGKMKKVKGLISLATSLLLFTATIAIIGNMDPWKAAQGIIAIGALLAMIAAFSNFTKNIKLSAMAGLVPLALSLLIFTASIKSLGSIDKNQLIQGIIALGAILAELAIFSKLVGSTSLLSGLGSSAIILSLTAFVSAFSGAIAKVKDVDPWVIGTFAGSVAVVMLVMAATIAIMSAIPFIGGIKAALLMGAFIVVLGAALAFAAETVAGAISNSLLEIGSALELMGTMIDGFITKMSSIDQSQVDNIALLFEKVGTMVSSIKSNNEITKFQGNLTSLGSGLRGMMRTNGSYDATTVGTTVEALKSIKTFINSLVGLPYDSVTSFVTALSSLSGAVLLFIGAEAGLTGESVGKDVESALGLLNSLVTGIPSGMSTTLTSLPQESELATFSAQLVALGGALVQFSDSTKDIESDKMTTAIGYLDHFGTIQTKLNLVGGIFALVNGYATDLTTFGSNISNIGSSLGDFADSTKGIDSGKMNQALKSLDIFNKLDRSLKNHGSIFEFFTGKSGLDTFGNDINIVGTGLSGFADKVKDIDSDSVSSATNAISMLAEIDKGLDSHGGLFSIFTGDNSIGGFADQLPKVGTALKNFTTNLSGYDPTNVSSAVNALVRISNAAKNIGNGNGDQLHYLFTTDFGSGIVNFFNEWMPKVKTDDAETVLSYIQDFSLIEYSSMAEAATSGFSTLANALETAISAIKKNCQINIGEVCKAIETKIRSYRTNFQTSGAYASEGFANGIRSGRYSAIRAATDLGNAALNALNASLDEHSPSKETEESGIYFVKGLIEGVNGESSEAILNVKTFGKDLVNSFTDSMSLDSAKDVGENLVSSIFGGFDVNKLVSDHLENGSVISNITDSISESLLGKNGSLVLGTKQGVLAGVGNVLTDLGGTKIIGTPTITPVIDSKKTENQLKDVVNSTNASANTSYSTSINAEMSKFLIDAQARNEDFVETMTNKIVSAIEDLGDRVDVLGDSIVKMKVVLDSGATVGQLEREIDAHLGQLIIHAGRGI